MASWIASTRKGSAACPPSGPSATSASRSSQAWRRSFTYDHSSSIDSPSSASASSAAIAASSRLPIVIVSIDGAYLNATPTVAARSAGLAVSRQRPPGSGRLGESGRPGLALDLFEAPPTALVPRSTVGLDRPVAQPGRLAPQAELPKPIDGVERGT